MRFKYKSAGNYKLEIAKSGDVVIEHCHEFQKDIKTKRPKF